MIKEGAGELRTANQREDEYGHRSHDKKDKGEQVGGLVTIFINVILDLRPDTKHPGTSGDEPTKAKETELTLHAESHIICFPVAVEPCPKQAGNGQHRRDSANLKKKGLHDFSIEV